MRYFKDYRFFLNENLQLADIYSSEEFKKWFGESVMKKDGVPIVFYHGTKNKFDHFSKDKISSSTDAGWLGYGFYFYTEYEEALQYGDISAYFLKIENPYYATDEENEMLAEADDIDISKDFTKNLIAEDYDGVYYNGNLRGETVVFEPNQIWKIDIDINDI